ncbi:MAG: DUF6778 family protein [Roseobacter sp.]
MRPLKLIMAVVAVAFVAGCASIDTASRNAPFEQSTSANAVDASGFVDPVLERAMPAYDVQAVNVIVPADLLVSEANRYYPSGDIVWREDPPGNRHEQVKAIFETAMAQGTADVQGEVPVVIDVQVMRFHALTEKTRYTIGGVHSIRFGLSIRSAETGLLLEERRVIQADLIGYGGQRALTAERQGLTQKVRITSHLSSVIKTELQDPRGYENPKLGLVQVLNNRL